MTRLSDDYLHAMRSLPCADDEVGAELNQVLTELLALRELERAAIVACEDCAPESDTAELLAGIRDALQAVPA